MTEVTAVPLRPIKRGAVTALWAGIGLLALGGLAAGWATTAGPVAAFSPAPEFLAWNGKRAGVKTTPSGLQYQVLKEGKGPKPAASDLAQLDYVGKLTNGTQFDANPKGQPAVMPIGQVVPGFSEALRLMARGARYRFWIPPALAYGEQAAGAIPANAVLMFDVTLHDFRPMPANMPGMPPGM